jgi:hypothetical protein
MKLTGENRRTGGKICPSATLSATNPTLTDPGSNPGLRGGKPATESGHGLSLLIELAAEVHLAEGELRSLKPKQEINSNLQDFDSAREGLQCPKG